MMTDHPGRWTARELLAYVAGEDHALHTVVSKTPLRREVSFTCSCGAVCIVSAKRVYVDALRNVGEQS